MANYLNLKAAKLQEDRDPIQSLWRNVLIVALEDAIKDRRYIDGCYQPLYAKNIKQSAVEYFTEPNADFALVCQYAGFDHTQVRSKVTKYLQGIKNERKNNLSKMQR